jgi:uncharacterized membrane protein
MIRYAIAYGGTALALAALDAVWLTLASKWLYRPTIGALMVDGFRLPPAIAFYVLYVAGIVIFAVSPALKAGQWTTATLMGGLFGLFCYATYDLTNQATLRVWPLRLTLIDIAWGVALTATAATMGYLAARRFG